MSFLHVVGIRLKVGHLLMNLCCWLVSIISMCWYSSVGGALGIKPCSLCNGETKWLNLKCWETISGKQISRICKKAPKSWCRELLGTWVVVWILLSLWIFCYMKSLNHEKRKETLGNMCDERARMLQDQFNVSMNHVQAMSILISTFHHGKNPSAIDQLTFARFTERTAFERPLMRGVAYAVRVVHSERERFEKQQGWTIKKMVTFEQTPDHKHDYASEKLKSSPYQEEYAPVMFAQDTVSHVISVDMLSGKEDRENIFRARASGKGVLTAPFRLIKTNRLGVILTFAVYRTDLPYNAAPDERIQASLGYFGGIFDIETLVEKLLQQLASTQTLVVNVYDITNLSNPISMYTSGSSSSSDVLEHVSRLNFGDPFRSHEMRCRFKQKPPWPFLATITSMGVLVIALLVGQIFYATKNRITKVEDDYQEMMELKKRAEAADIAKSQFLATVSHEIRTPMNGVLGMLDMLMDTDLDVTQRDYVRTAQASGKALVSLINEVLDQARIEFGKLELEAVRFDLRAIMDDVLSLFSGKSQEKNVELAVYVSDRVPEILIGDPGRFRQIITNLMGNSIKFTEKGHIFVTVHLVEEVMNSKKVDTESLDKSTLSGFRVAERCCSWSDFKALRLEGPSYPFPVSDPIHLIVSVEDTGVGIPIEDQSRVFTPFMQMGPSVSRVGGTGIGLSISKCLVGLMNGDIGFVSKPKIGSTFTFTGVFSNGCTNFEDYEGQKINHQSDPASSDFMGMTALVVDPRAVRAMVSRYHIERLGIHVDIASDLNQDFSALCRGTSNTSKVVDMVFVEQEAWDDCLGFSALFVNKLTKLGCGVPPKLFILTNSIGSSSTRTPTSDVYSPTFIRKPLRASMLAASLQQTMGAGSKRKSHNGKVLSLSPSFVLRGRKILVVDDNCVNLRVAAGALKKYGADVVIASSGKEAISLLEPPHSFDACFMDIQMPEMDGFEATGKIRDTERNINLQIQCGEVSPEAYENVSNWHVPILAMTADVIQATHEKCLKSGMDGYVSKPFEAERLCGEVSRVFQ